MAKKRPNKQDQNTINAEWLKLRIKSHPLSPRQKDFLGLSLDHETSIVFISGPAGSTKTYMAVLAALREVQKTSDFPQHGSMVHLYGKHGPSGNRT